MAIIVYNNGLTEDYRPKELVFTDEELVFLFTEYPEMKTIRIPSVLNTWCIYGAGKDNIEEFNRIVSEIIGDRVFSHALFVHDSEINPKWNVTDDVLYKNYSSFLKSMKKVIEEVSIMIMNEFIKNEEYRNSSDTLPQLITLGLTPDKSKRILFGFNPHDQKKEFYTNEEFAKFSTKIYEYLVEHKQTNYPFRIYEDKKVVIIIETDKEIKSFLESLLNNFRSTEEYEKMEKITKIMNDWDKNHSKTSKRSGDNNNNEQ